MDYKKLKFKAGLEIHQQLDTKKLFCDCPSVLNDDKDIKIKRKLRVSAGESGEKDIAAEFETLKDKEFIYEGSKENTCLVEFDEEPPHKLNQDSLNIILQVCLLLNCKLVDEIEIMRKIVVDGSNTSGFQRTALIGYEGYIKTSKGKVGIQSLCLEEDSARKIKEDKNSVTYRLDRLGIPLIEIATDADIKDPEHCKEVAEKLGMILRSTGKVKRGLGTIRQDVNISIKNGNRVEIKGFQDLRKMPLIIDNEIKRQLKGNVKKEVRKANADGTTSFMRPMPGAARMYPETDIKPVEITSKMLKEIKKPELIDEKILNLEKLGLNSNIARSLVKSGINLKDYDYKLDKKLIVNILVEMPKNINTRNNLDYKFKEKDFRLVLKNLESNKINKEAAYEILTLIAQGKDIDLKKFESLDVSKIEEDVKKIIKKNKELSIDAIMGILMEKYRGKVDGKTISELVKKNKS